MTDAYITMGPDGGQLELTGGGAIRTSDGLEAAGIISLFGGNDEDNGTDATEAMQWWGNRIEADPDRVLRSQTGPALRTLPLTSGNVRRIREAAVRDLSWFTSSGIADDVSVSVTVPSRNRIDMANSVTIGQSEYPWSLSSLWSSI